MVETRSSNSLISILKGTILSIFLTLILLIIFALLLTYTNINENTMPAVIIIAIAISILVGSQITTGKIKRNGIINGIIVGSLYIFILYILSSIITKDFSFSKYSIIMIITSVLIGGIGGIIGVNRK